MSSPLEHRNDELLLAINQIRNTDILRLHGPALLPRNKDRKLGLPRHLCFHKPNSRLYRRRAEGIYENVICRDRAHRSVVAGKQSAARMISRIQAR
jgi:hypothetical protein